MHSLGRGLVAALLLAVAMAARGGAQGAAPRATPFTLDVGAFHQALDNGYSDWDGLDARLSYTNPVASPFASASRQRRREGSQAAYGLGSYLTINRHFYSIVGFSVATGGTAVFYPRLRWDASLIGDSRVVPGLMIATGYTYVGFGGGASGSIISLGPIWYHGPLILSGAMHLNHDDVGGASSGSAEAGGQYGSQGRYWVGANVSAGHEAYEILSATPLDVQFTNVGASAFYQRWLTQHTALTARLEYQDKRTAYHRRGVALSYQVAF